MSKKRRPLIEPKPTQYGNVLFRSRLEARWAVFFDYASNVLNWTYEPCTFTLKNGWEYTPDFLVTLFLDITDNNPTKQPSKQKLYIDIKPTHRIDKTVTDTLREVAYQKNVTIFLLMGDFYKYANEG